MEAYGSSSRRADPAGPCVAVWRRTNLQRKDDWYGYAKVTDTEVVLFEPTATDKSSREIDHRVYRALSVGHPAGPRDRSATFDRLVARVSGKTRRIDRDELVGLDAFATGRLVRFRTTGESLVVSQFAHPDDVTTLACGLSRILFCGAPPRRQTATKPTRDLLRPLGNVVVSAAVVSAISITLKIWTGSLDDPYSGESDPWFEDIIDRIPLVAIAAAAAAVVAYATYQAARALNDVVSFDASRAVGIEAVRPAAVDLIASDLSVPYPFEAG